MDSNFIISIDFELIWGMHEGDILNNSYNENIKGGRYAIPTLLKLFEKYGIHATWAVVGLMFAENFEEAKKYFPPESMQPTYRNINMSPYPLIKQIDKLKTDDTLYFAPDVIEQIGKTEGQEIASHTFSHFYCMEEGQTTVQFEADMIAAKAIANRIAAQVPKPGRTASTAGPTLSSIASREPSRPQTIPSETPKLGPMPHLMEGSIARTRMPHMPKYFSVEDT